MMNKTFRDIVFLYYQKLIKLLKLYSSKIVYYTVIIGRLIKVNSSLDNWQYWRLLYRIVRTIHTCLLTNLLWTEMETPGHIQLFPGLLCLLSYELTISEDLSVLEVDASSSWWPKETVSSVSFYLHLHI